MNRIKINIFTISLAIFGFMAAGCSDFLDETPNKSGSAYIYHMDQLYEMTGSPDIYMFYHPAYMPYGITGNYMNEQVLMSDAIEISPEYFSVGLEGSSWDYLTYCMDNEEWTNDQYGMDMTWTPSWERIYRFNTVLENIDKVIQTTADIHDQVAGESYFGRAYYHFILMLQYCLWDEDKPGIGYREDTTPNGIPTRETVGYTLGKIYADLDKAEELLTKAGKTEFDQKTNFRPTLPTVKAFRARVDLYRGDYDSALKNANAALTAHNALVDFKNDPNYELVPLAYISYLNETNTQIERMEAAAVPYNVWMLGMQQVAVYEELYLSSMSSGNYLPMSENYYNLFDKDNDARWIYFYNSYYPMMMASGLYQTVEIDGMPTPGCVTWENQQWLKPSTAHSYFRFYGNGSVNFLGMTTAEMYLIKAECLARTGDSAGAADALKTLRRTRFMDNASADNIGGSIQEVLDERYREMTGFWRFYDMKRLNGAENAGLSITRKILSDQTDPNSVIDLTIGPDDPRWALPIYKVEAKNMGWEQNEGWN